MAGMIYATLQDLIDRFGATPLAQLTDRQQPFAGQVHADTVDSALADASAEIDAYVHARYPDGFVSPPRLLTQACCVLAWLVLHRDRPTEAVIEAATTVRTQLRLIADGKMALPETVNVALHPSQQPTEIALDGSFSLDKLEAC